MHSIEDESNAEVESLVYKWVHNKLWDLHKIGTWKLLERWKKCINYEGDHQNKLWKIVSLSLNSTFIYHKIPGHIGIESGKYTIIWKVLNKILWQTQEKTNFCDWRQSAHSCQTSSMQVVSIISLIRSKLFETSLSLLQQKLLHYSSSLKTTAQFSHNIFSFAFASRNYRAACWLN